MSCGTLVLAIGMAPAASSAATWGSLAVFDLVPARRQAECRCRADEVETLLDRYREAGERPQLFAARQRPVDLGGFVSRAVIQLHGHRVELGIDRFSRAMKCSTASAAERSRAAMRRTISPAELSRNACVDGASTLRGMSASVMIRTSEDCANAYRRRLTSIHHTMLSIGAQRALALRASSQRTNPGWRCQYR